MMNRTEARPTSQAALRFAHRTVELRIAWHVARAQQDRAVSVAAGRFAA